MHGEKGDEYFSMFCTDFKHNLWEGEKQKQKDIAQMFDDFRPTFP